MEFFTANELEPWQPCPTNWIATYGISVINSTNSNPSPQQQPSVHAGDTPPPVADSGAAHLYLHPHKPGAYATYTLPGERQFWIRYEYSSQSDTLTSYQPIKKRLFHRVFSKTSNAEGTVVLIGEAAHPMTTFLGQGGCRGIEEGVELLNGLLRQSWATGKEVDENLVGVKWFVDQGMERSKLVAKISWLLGFFVMGDWRILRWTRDRFLRFFACQYNGEDQSGDCDRDRDEDEGEQKKNWLFSYSPVIQTEDMFWKSVGVV
jgi:hypothetical protein